MKIFCNHNYVNELHFHMVIKFLCHLSSNIFVSSYFHNTVKKDIEIQSGLFEPESSEF